MTAQKNNPYFVTQTNPEILAASPRPGGVAKIDVPPKVNKLLEKVKAEKEKSQTNVRSSRSRHSSKVPTKVVEAPTGGPSRKSLLTLANQPTVVKDLTIDMCPKEFKVKQILAATPWSVEFDEYYEPTEESKRIPDPFQDSVDMLAMSISVIMLLSRGHNEINESHLKWVISYLDCIRDEFGQLPPNVQGMLNHINAQTGGKIKSFLDEDEDLAEPPPA